EELRQWLAGVSASQAAGQPTFATPVPEKADLLKRVGGNARLLRQMVRTFRRDSVKKLAEMKRALGRKDGMALATAAHALKGSASLFGSASATEKAQLLQDMGRKEDLAQARPVLRELDEAIAQLREELRGYDAVNGRKRQAKKRSTAKPRRRTGRRDRLKRAARG